MKIVIAYSSKTGNTKKLCTGVYDRLKERYDVDITTVKELGSLDNYDIIIPGFWVDKGTANREAKKFITKIRNKKVALLGTLGASPDSEHGDKVRVNIEKLIDSSNEYLGVFLSRGKVNEKLIKRIKFLPLSSEIRQKMYDSSVSSREPNEEDMENGTNFLCEKIEK